MAPQLSIVRASRCFSGYAPADPKSLNWSTLGFSYVPTKAMITTDFVDGKWTSPKSSNEPFLQIHALSNVRIVQFKKARVRTLKLTILNFTGVALWPSIV